ncbi:MAG: dihydropteroate synthase [Desulfatibacillaceae bacterium]|nr:dihydropteroate synthase [Desulfatibacillaceae bacterium]
MRDFLVEAGKFRLELGACPLVMGIVNVTPDSFSDGGQFFDADKAVAHGLELAEQGADILDVGGESTRPFSDPVSQQEEERRVLPVIERLSRLVNIPISIDTQRASTAKRALEAGASIINDISALGADPGMAALAAKTGAPVILMHMLDKPKTMQENPRYADVVADVRDFLAKAIARSVAAGIGREKIIVDPGIGFGKTVEHNLLLIKNLDALHQLGVPVLLGHSRKSFIRKTLAKKALPDRAAEDYAVEMGTQAVTAFALIKGVHIVRVHGVAAARAVVDMTLSLQAAGA